MKFFGKVKAWCKKHRPTKRRLIQLYAALLTNANLKGFITGNIYRGPTKYACVPGLNCYSCPGAVGACPLGALQNALAQSNTRAPYYILGIIVLFGILLGRTICGFLCPMGLGQELLYKIKTPKLKKSRFTRVLSYLKYVILAVFVVAIPLMYSLQSFPDPAFCKYICPAGTLGGGVGLLLNPSNEGLFESLGPIFTWKFALMCAICVACVFIFRAFCRFLCPLGAIYGFFNRIALIGVKLDRDACTHCGLCVAHCKMDIKSVGDHECVNCGECIDVCPAKAISWKGSKLFVHANPVLITEPSEEARPLGAFLDRTREQTEELSSEPMTEPAASAEELPAEPITESTAPAEELPAEPAAPAAKERTNRRGRGFWLRFGAWATALAVLVVALVYYNFLVPAPPPTGAEIGDTVPDFTLSAYFKKDETYTVSRQRGKVVVLNFWTTSCGPCVEEIPDFGVIAEEYGDRVSIAIIHGTEITEDVEAFILRQGWGDFDVFFLQDDETYRVYETLGGKALWPMTVILDQDGVIRYLHESKLSYEATVLEIESLL